MEVNTHSAQMSLTTTTTSTKDKASKNMGKEVLDSDYADYESDSHSEEIDEDSFLSYHLEDILDMYSDVKGRCVPCIDVLGNCNSTTFTNLVVQAIFSPNKLGLRKDTTLTYRQKRYMDENLDTLHELFNNVHAFIEYLAKKHDLISFLTKDIFCAWAVKYSCV